MSKGKWLALAAAALIVGTAGAGAEGFIVAALALGVPYLIGYVFHPRTIHRACNGTGYHRSPWYPWSTRKCRGCSGGLQVRHGARAVGQPHIRAEHQRRASAVRKARQGHSWR